MSFYHSGKENLIQTKNIYAEIKKASEFRAEGKIVELALTPQNFDAAKISQAEKNYDELIYLK